MSATHTPQSFYEALKGVIVNLPENASEIGIEFRPNALPVMRATVTLLRDGEPVIEGGKFATATALFKIVPAADFTREESVERLIAKARNVVSENNDIIRDTMPELHRAIRSLGYAVEALPK
jgi:hypothetical protein